MDRGETVSDRESMRRRQGASSEIRDWPLAPPTVEPIALMLRRALLLADVPTAGPLGASPLASRR
jgi:hypothetical protein